MFRTKSIILITFSLISCNHDEVKLKKESTETQTMYITDTILRYADSEIIHIKEKKDSLNRDLTKLNIRVLTTQQYVEYIERKNRELTDSLDRLNEELERTKQQNKINLVEINKSRQKLKEKEKTIETLEVKILQPKEIQIDTVIVVMEDTVNVIEEIIETVEEEKLDKNGKKRRGRL